MNSINVNNEKNIDLNAFHPITDEKQNELLRHQPFMFRYQHHSHKLDTPFHSHHGYEIIYVESGEGNIVIKDKIFPINKRGIYLINLLELHKIRITGEKPYTRTIINFTSDFLQSWSRLSGGIDLLGMFQHAPMDRYVSIPETNLKQFNQLLDLVHNRNQNHAHTAGLQLGLLNILYEIYSLMEDHSLGKRKSVSKSLPETHVERIIKYIELHFHEKLAIDRVAKELFLSKYYVSHIFRHVTGQTFQSYLLSKRINEARRLLILTDLNVLEVAHQVGFTSPTYFSNVFKTYNGVSPVNFRRKMKDVKEKKM